MYKKALLVLTMAALITSCSPAPAVSSTASGNQTSGQTTAMGSDTTQPTVTGSSTTAFTSADTTTPIGTVSTKPIQSELGKPIVFDQFEITINSIKKFAKGVMVDYTFVNRQGDAFSPNYMSNLQLSQDGTQLFSDPFFRYEDRTVQQRANYRNAQIRRDIPVNLLGFFSANSDSPVTILVVSKIGTLQRSEPLVVDLPKAEFNVSEISPLAEIPAGVKPIADTVPAIKVGDVLELQTMKIVIDGIYSLKNSQDMDGVLLEYTRTRNPDDKDYQTDFHVSAFQHGITLNPSFMNGPTAVIDALGADSYKLLPGISVKSLEYIVYPEDKTELEFEFNEWKNFKPVKRVSVKTATPPEKITLAQLEANLKTANDKNRAAAQAFLPQAEDRTLIGKKLEYKNSELTFNGVRRAKNEEENLIIDITFKHNSTGEPVLSVALIVVYQNGVQLNRNFNFKDPADQILNNDLSSGVPDQSVEGVLSFQMRDDSLVVIEIYENRGRGKDVGPKQVLVIKP